MDSGGRQHNHLVVWKESGEGWGSGGRKCSSGEGGEGGRWVENLCILIWGCVGGQGEMPAYASASPNSGKMRKEKEPGSGMFILMDGGSEGEEASLWSGGRVLSLIKWKIPRRKRGGDGESPALDERRQWIFLPWHVIHALIRHQWK